MSASYLNLNGIQRYVDLSIADTEFMKKACEAKTAKIFESQLRERIQSGGNLHLHDSYDDSTFFSRLIDADHVDYIPILIKVMKENKELTMADKWAYYIGIHTLQNKDCKKELLELLDLKELEEIPAELSLPPIVLAMGGTELNEMYTSLKAQKYPNLHIGVALGSLLHESPTLENLINELSHQELIDLIYFKGLELPLTVWRPSLETAVPQLKFPIKIAIHIGDNFLNKVLQTGDLATFLLMIHSLQKRGLNDELSQLLPYLHWGKVRCALMNSEPNNWKELENVEDFLLNKDIKLIKYYDSNYRIKNSSDLIKLECFLYSISHDREIDIGIEGIFLLNFYRKFLNKSQLMSRNDQLLLQEIFNTLIQIFKISAAKEANLLYCILIKIDPERASQMSNNSVSSSWNLDLYQSSLKKIELCHIMQYNSFGLPSQKLKELFFSTPSPILETRPALLNDKKNNVNKRLVVRQPEETKQWRKECKNALLDIIKAILELEKNEVSVKEADKMSILKKLQNNEENHTSFKFKHKEKFLNIIHVNKYLIIDDQSQTRVISLDHYEKIFSQWQKANDREIPGGAPLTNFFFNNYYKKIMNGDKVENFFTFLNDSIRTDNYWDDWDLSKNSASEIYQNTIHPLFVDYLSQIINYIPLERPHVVELCGGKAFLTKQLLEKINKPIHLTFLEYNEKSLIIAKQHLNKELPNGSSAQVVKADIVKDSTFFADAKRSQPLLPNSQDIVFGCGALTQFVLKNKKEALQALIKIETVLKPGGYLLLAGVANSLLTSIDFHAGFEIINTIYPKDGRALYLVRKKNYEL